MQKLIPFDLKRALSGDRLVTRDGRRTEIRLIKVGTDTCSPSIEAELMEEPAKCTHRYDLEGKMWYLSSTETCCVDLFMAPEIEEEVEEERPINSNQEDGGRWVNVCQCTCNKDNENND